MLRLEWKIPEGLTLLDKRLRKAVKRAGDDALRAMRANTKKTVRSTKRIKAKFLANKALPLKFPRGARHIAELQWTMSVSGKPVPLSEFPARQNKKGVRVEVNTGAPKTIRSAFLANLRASRSTSGLGVFLRPTKARYPMGHMLGPNVADSVKKYIPFILEHTQSAFRKRFPYWMQKYRGEK